MAVYPTRFIGEHIPKYDGRLEVCSSARRHRALIRDDDAAVVLGVLGFHYDESAGRGRVPASELIERARTWQAVHDPDGATAPDGATDRDAGTGAGSIDPAPAHPVPASRTERDSLEREATHPEATYPEAAHPEAADRDAADRAVSWIPEPRAAEAYRSSPHDYRAAFSAFTSGLTGVRPADWIAWRPR